MRKQDYIKRYISDTGIRLSIAVTTSTVGSAASRHHLWPVATVALGRTLTGALLLSGDFKNNENVSIRIKGNGPLGSVYVDAYANNRVRGYVDHPQVDLPLNQKGKLDVGGAVGHEGHVQVTRFIPGYKEYTSQAKLVSGEIAEDLAYYLYTSEQVPSAISLGVLVGTEDDVLAAGGFLVQALPDATADALDTIEANIASIGPITAYLQQHPDGEGLADRIMQGFQYKEVYENDVAFSCTCSKERFQQILMTLPKKDKQDLLADDRTELVCHYCNDKYYFTKDELEKLFSEDEVV